MNKKPISTCLVATGCAVAVVITSVALAQPAAKPGTARNSPYWLEIQSGALLSPEGKQDATLENVVERLRELEQVRSGNPANIVLSPDLPKIAFANLKLASTTLVQELEALRVASGEKFVWSLGDATPPMNVDPATGLPIPAIPGMGGSAQGGSVPLFILRPALESSRSSLRVEAFSLASYFEMLGLNKLQTEEEQAQRMAKEVEQIERMVDETFDIYRSMQKELEGGAASRLRSPALRFHRGASLMVVIGEPEAVELAAQVIGALPGVHRSSGAGGGFGAAGSGAVSIPGLPHLPGRTDPLSRYGVTLPPPGPGGSPGVR